MNQAQPIQATQDCKNKQDQYVFNCIENDPSTLTMTKRPQIILRNMMQFPTYVLIYEKIGQAKQFKNIFEKQIEKKLLQFQTITQAYAYIKSSQEMIILLVSVQLFKEAEIAFYGNKKIVKTIIYEQGKQSQILINISGMISQNCRFKEYSNFLHIQQQVKDSNILIKTMYVMLKQYINRQKAVEQITKLWRLLSPSEENFIREFQLKAKKRPLQFKQAIYFYTNQSTLYKLINNILRASRDPTQILILHPFFHDLFTQIQLVYKKQEKQQKFKCYRGGIISEYQLNKLKKGKIVQNLSFLSTSKNLSVVKNFVCNVLFEILVSNNSRHCQNDYGYAQIKMHSFLKSEQQILFNPLNSFKVIDIQMKQNIYYIKLEYGQLARIMCKKNQQVDQHQLQYKLLGLHQIEQKEKYENIGKILIIKNFKRKQSFDYWSTYVKIATKCNNIHCLSYGLLNSGHNCRAKGDFKQAIKKYEQFIQLIQKSDLRVRYSFMGHVYLGLIYVLMGKNQQTHKYFQNCQKIYKEYQHSFSGQEKADILNIIGHMNFRQGYYNQALQVFNSCKQIISKLYGQTHIINSTILNNIAVIYRSLSKYSEAIRFYRQSLQIRKRLLGETHIRCAEVLLNMSGLFKELSRYKQALQIFSQCENILKLNPEQIFLCATYLNSYGMFKISLRKYNQGLKILLKSRQKYTQLYYSQQNDITAINLNNIAIAYEYLGDYQNAMSYYLKCKNIRQQSHNNNQIQLARILNNIGSVYHNQKKFDEALTYYKRSSQIYLKYIGERNLQYSRIIKNIGTTFKHMRRLSEALNYFTKSLQIKLTLIGQSHSSCALTMENIAQVYNQYNNLQKCLQFYERSLRIKRVVFGQFNQQVGESYKQIGKVHYKYKNNSKAQEYYLKFKQIYLQNNQNNFNKFNEENPEIYLFLKSMNNQIDEQKSKQYTINKNCRVNNQFNKNTVNQNIKRQVRQQFQFDVSYLDFIF